MVQVNSRPMGEHFIRFCNLVGEALYSNNNNNLYSSLPVTLYTSTNASTIFPRGILKVISPEHFLNSCA